MDAIQGSVFLPTCKGAALASQWKLSLSCCRLNSEYQDALANAVARPWQSPSPYGLPTAFAEGLAKALTTILAKNLATILAINLDKIKGSCARS